jgi:hypothetical protein
MPRVPTGILNIKQFSQICLISLSEQHQTLVKVGTIAPVTAWVISRWHSWSTEDRFQNKIKVMMKMRMKSNKKHSSLVGAHKERVIPKRQSKRPVGRPMLRWLLISRSLRFDCLQAAAT